ncbi:MAG: hypothetical protein ACOYL5_09840 [Phototrophicaceae bacterium]|jgi:hypothetical protein
MSVKVYWYDDAHTILVQAYAGRPTQQDYYEGSFRAIHAINEVSHSVDMIIDFNQARPSIRQVLIVAEYTNRNKAQYLNTVVVSGRRVIIQLFLESVRRFFPIMSSSSYYASSFQESLSLIQQKRRKR